MPVQLFVKAIAGLWVLTTSSAWLIRKVTAVRGITKEGKPNVHTYPLILTPDEVSILEKSTVAPILRRGVERWNIFGPHVQDAHE